MTQVLFLPVFWPTCVELLVCLASGEWELWDEGFVSQVLCSHV